jgi:hypothetical protein
MPRRFAMALWLALVTAVKLFRDSILTGHSKIFAAMATLALVSVFVAERAWAASLGAGRKVVTGLAGLRASANQVFYRSDR